MFYIADLHIHSRFSRATSKDLTLESLHTWAQLKGVHVVAAADFTHPAWFAELRERLEEAEPGLFRLRGEFAAPHLEEVPKRCRSEVRFLLTVELSTIYKKGNATRKVHHVIFVPGLASAAKLTAELAKIGNVQSDGRPILGMDSRHLLEMTLEADPDAFLVPAHIWTPHFSVLGAASGFDSIEECYGDLSEHIFALETGLSSDPPMNWRLSALDRFTLISNSDAHSAEKLMREANLFDTELSYYALRDALRHRPRTGWRGTIEFFPEEGKYHLDGHRLCHQRLTPAETREHDGRCPACGKKVTIGVLHRVESLADRPAGNRPPNASPYLSLVPLTEILAQVHQQGDKTRRIQAEYRRLLEQLGSEYFILAQTPLDQIARVGSPLLARAIDRMRRGQVQTEPGYDGEYGVVHALREEDRTQTGPSQLALFDLHVEPRTDHLLEGLNPAQRTTVEASNGPLLVLAGAGTGKTKALTHRLAWQLTQTESGTGAVLAVAFTQKASAEIRDRVHALLQEHPAGRPWLVATLHSVSARLLQRFGEPIGVSPGFRIASEAQQISTARGLLETRECPPGTSPSWLLDAVAALKHRGYRSDNPDMGLGLVSEVLAGVRPGLGLGVQDLAALYAAYQAALQASRLMDFDDLILRCTDLLEHPAAGPAVRAQFKSVLVDEAQDLNEAQYHWLRALTADHQSITLVGDPDQSIYRFRGANAHIFQRFLDDYPGARTVRLEENYRCPPLVLHAAEQLMASAPNRLQKRLFTRREGGRKIQIWDCDTSATEAAQVVRTIQGIVGETRMEHRDARGDTPFTGVARSFSDIAILTRTNAQHAAFAETLHKAGIPFQAASVTRKKPSPRILEILCRLRQAARPDDDEATEYFLLETVQGFGEKAVQSIRQAAADAGTSMFGALAHAIQTNQVPSARRASTQNLLQQFDRLRGDLAQRPLDVVVEGLLTESGLLTAEAKDPDALFLLLLAAQYAGRSSGTQDASRSPWSDTDALPGAGTMMGRRDSGPHLPHPDPLPKGEGGGELGAPPSGGSLPLRDGESGPGAPAPLLAAEDPGQYAAIPPAALTRIGSFLADVALRIDSDLVDPRAESVKLLTIHAAKGLEFPVVFLSGVEEGLLPVDGASKDLDQIEEERRLIYVAMTRAREALILIHCRKRQVYGEERAASPSRFLDCMPVTGFERQRFERVLSRREKADRGQLRLF